jgi:hypothetical protein
VTGKLARLHRLRLDGPSQRPQAKVDENNETGDERRMYREASAGKRVAAVLKPRTLSASLKIRPAPIKPMPDTTGAATLGVLLSSGTTPENTKNEAAASATSVPEPGQTLAPLPLETDRRSQHCCGTEIEHGPQKAAAHHGLTPVAMALWFDAPRPRRRRSG